jgi:starvation-inducible DNA-binding protein
MAAGASRLPEYPHDIFTGDAHITALSTALGGFGHNVREGIDELEAMSDPISVDILTEIGRGTDQWLWFVEAHQQIPASAEHEER